MRIGGGQLSGSPRVAADDLCVCVCLGPCPASCVATRLDPFPQRFSGPLVRPDHGVGINSCCRTGVAGQRAGIDSVSVAARVAPRRIDLTRHPDVRLRPPGPLQCRSSVGSQPRSRTDRRPRGPVQQVTAASGASLGLDGSRSEERHRPRRGPPARRGALANSSRLWGHVCGVGS